MTNKFSYDIFRSCTMHLDAIKSFIFIQVMHNFNLNVNFNILIEQSNFASVG